MVQFTNNTKVFFKWCSCRHRYGFVLKKFSSQLHGFVFSFTAWHLQLAIYTIAPGQAKPCEWTWLMETEKNTCLCMWAFDCIFFPWHYLIVVNKQPLSTRVNWLGLSCKISGVVIILENIIITMVDQNIGYGRERHI